METPLITDGDCSDDGRPSGLGTYTIGGEEGGRYACYFYPDGSFEIMWTTPQLNILSWVSDYVGDDDAVWDQWVDAGPNQ